MFFCVPEGRTRDRNGFSKNHTPCYSRLYCSRGVPNGETWMLYFLDTRRGIRCFFCVRTIYFRRTKSRENRGKCRASHWYYAVHWTELMPVWRHTDTNVTGIKNPNAGTRDCFSKKIAFLITLFTRVMRQPERKIYMLTLLRCLS